MSVNSEPTKAPQVFIQRGDGKYSVPPSNGYQCPKSSSGSHWWYIHTTDGAVSAGVCRYCGARRQFANSISRVFRTRVQR